MHRKVTEYDSPRKSVFIPQYRVKKGLGGRNQLNIFYKSQYILFEHVESGHDTPAVEVVSHQRAGVVAMLVRVHFGHDPPLLTL